MNIVVKARHMNVTEAMREYVESKLNKLPHFYDAIHLIEATLDIEAEQAAVEIVVTAGRKHTFVARHRQEDMYACVDECLQKMTQQIRRHKDKLRTRQGAVKGRVVVEAPEQ